MDVFVKNAEQFASISHNGFGFDEFSKRTCVHKALFRRVRVGGWIFSVHQISTAILQSPFVYSQSIFVGIGFEQ